MIFPCLYAIKKFLIEFNIYAVFKTIIKVFAFKTKEREMNIMKINKMNYSY